MDTSRDDSDSEEEIFVFADFKNLLDRDILKPGNLRVVKAIGMDSETPVIQLNNYFFQGENNNTSLSMLGYFHLFLTYILVFRVKWKMKVLATTLFSTS